jgi:hypothetical protein
MVFISTNISLSFNAGSLISFYSSTSELPNADNVNAFIVYWLRPVKIRENSPDPGIFW